MWLLVAALLIGRNGRTRRTNAARPSRRVLQIAAGAATVAMVLALVPMPAGAAVALCLAPLGGLLAGRLHDRPARAATHHDAALALALAAAALRAGVPVATALELARPAANAEVADVLGRVAGLLRLGAAPEQAWSVLPADGAWSSIGAMARRSGHSGIRLADAFERAAAQLLAQQRADALARAQRVSVLAVGPLGACFLPAFVCLGIVPVVIAVAAGIGGQLR